jgi:hypothetical protein
MTTSTSVPATGIPATRYLDALAGAGAGFTGVRDFPVEWEVAQLRRLVPEGAGDVPFDRLLPVLDLSEDRFYHWDVRAAVVATAARRALGETGRPVPVQVNDGDYEVRDRRVVTGSLDIRGRLVLWEGAELVVLGDVRAADVVELDDHGDHGGYYATFACGGDLAVDGLVSTGGGFVVAVSLTAEVVLAYYNQGFLIVGGDLRTKVLYESDHGGSVVLGTADTGAALIDEMHGVPDDGHGGDRLLGLVRWELVEEVRSLIDDNGRADLAMEDLLTRHALARTLLR